MIVGPSPRAHALSQHLTALIQERRSQDPGLNVPDTLVALDLVKSSLLAEAGVPDTSRRVMVALSLVLGAVLAGLVLLL